MEDIVKEHGNMSENMKKMGGLLVLKIINFNLKNRKIEKKFILYLDYGLTNGKHIAIIAKNN